MMITMSTNINIIALLAAVSGLVGAFSFAIVPIMTWKLRWSMHKLEGMQHVKSADLKTELRKRHEFFLGIENKCNAVGAIFLIFSFVLSIWDSLR